VCLFLYAPKYMLFYALYCDKVVSSVCHTSRCACTQRSELSWSFNRATHRASSTSSRAQRANRRPLNDIGARRDRRSVRRCRSVGDIRTRWTSFVRGRLGDWRRTAAGTLSRCTHCRRRLWRHVALYSCSAKRWWCRDDVLLTAAAATAAAHNRWLVSASQHWYCDKHDYNCS